MTSYSVSQNQIVTAMFYFFLVYTDTAFGSISFKLTYTLKSFSTPNFQDEGASSNGVCIFSNTEIEEDVVVIENGFIAIKVEAAVHIKV